MPQRNLMTMADVTETTELNFHKIRLTWGRGKDRYRPSVTYVSAIKPCGCEGPTLGHIETVPLPKVPASQRWDIPRAWRHYEHGYTLVQETKDRIALFRNGERLYGKRWFGGNIDQMLRRLAWNHYRYMVAEAGRPKQPDGKIYSTALRAMEHRPRQQCKLWGLFPDRPYRYNAKKPKPIGFVWGEAAAAQALKRYWVIKNREKAAEKVAA